MANEYLGKTASSSRQSGQPKRPGYNGPCTTPRLTSDVHDPFFGEEVERGFAALVLAEAAGLGAAEGHLGLAAEGRDIDVQHTCLAGAGVGERLADVAGVD